MNPRLYLAGPEVFRPDALAEGERLKALAARLGAEGVYPLDGEPLHEAGAIKRRCREMIDAADAVVANVTPFRGHHMDPGTAWEIGYAEARGKPVHLWSGDPRPMLARVRPADADEMGWRDAEGHLIEDFELVENLMIAADAGPVEPTPEAAMRAAIEGLRARDEARANAHAARRLVLWIAAAIAAALLLAAAISSARAEIRVIDGDTIVVDGEHIRLTGLDAPEIRHARCPAERRRGEQARERLTALLTQACGPLAEAGPRCLGLQREPVRDRYGRSLARLSVEGRDVADELIEAGLAAPYPCTNTPSGSHCPRRPNWCGEGT